MLVHGGCAARGEWGVLLLGPAGAGKSDLLLRLLDIGWSLVADDQVEIETGVGDYLAASAPPTLSGMLEVRGIGVLVDVPVTPRTSLRLVARLAAAAAVPRLPDAEFWNHAGQDLPAIALDPFAASAPQKLGIALDVILGSRRLAAGIG
ncbi:MAG: aldolase [Rhodospirillales bacterium]|jgi:HPr kinase/phosphorylase|nr:aldolase [Rhodospirillales bacterium]